MKQAPQTIYMNNQKRRGKLFAATLSLPAQKGAEALRRKKGIEKHVRFCDKSGHQNYERHEAVLMCDNTNLQDAEIKELCRGIISSQQTEIDWMKVKLNELEKR
ncbi:MAG: hypothetical protein ABI539_02280 [Acidobacteriota bacterium]